VTLWSAGLNPGDLPNLSPRNLMWLVKNPLLAMYSSATVLTAMVSVLSGKIAPAASHYARDAVR
jgi:hypothetical protein